MISRTPEAPYYAVIFTTQLANHSEEYAKMAKELAELVKSQPGFLGMESARNEIGITVSYWKDLDSIKRWKENSKHMLAQEKGKNEWYVSYKTRISKVERDYDYGM